MGRERGTAAPANSTRELVDAIKQAEARVKEKMGISEADLERVREQIRAKAGEEAWQSLERDNWTVHNER